MPDVGIGGVVAGLAVVALVALFVEDVVLARRRRRK